MSSNRAKVYIDGHVGTTGLRIRDWLRGRDDLEVLDLPEATRKDPSARRARVDEADVAVLCLPDDAAREAAGWAAASGTRVVDASTAHRVAEDWAYGLPELDPGRRALIGSAARVSNPGCYPSGFVLLVRPLGRRGRASAGCAARGARPFRLLRRRPRAHRAVGVAGQRARRPSLRGALCARTHAQAHPGNDPLRGTRPEPQFLPAVGPFRCGMRVQVPLPAGTAAGDGTRLHEVLADRYADEPFVRVAPIPKAAPDEWTLDPRACNDTNRIDLPRVPASVGARPAGRDPGQPRQGGVGRRDPEPQPHAGPRRGGRTARVQVPERVLPCPELPAGDGTRHF